MAQFDVHRNPRGGTFPLLLDVQAELLADLATRIVVPLSPKRSWDAALSRLNPTAVLRGIEYVLVFQELAAVPRTALGPVVGSLASRRADLVAALDVLFTGI